ncbi:MAG: hypothetical protein ACM3XQ_09795 [Nocardioidaceae bacterium]
MKKGVPLRLWLLVLAGICAITAIYHAGQGRWTGAAFFAAAALVAGGTEVYRSRSKASDAG